MQYSFDEFVVDTDRLELRRDGLQVATEPQVFALLCLLIEQRDRVLSRDEISDIIWRGKVVSDAAISSRIKSLRQALGDDGKRQRYVRTLHGAGFRFVGEVADPAPQVAAVEKPDMPPGTEQALPGASADSPEPATARPVIAVLPFANLSRDADQEYLSDAISQDILSHLARHRWLSVIARNSSFGYRGRAVAPGQLARELGASYVVEGAVQRAGDRIRVSVELGDANDGRQVWSARYDRDMQDIFDLQDEITERVAAQLEPEIGLAERQKVHRARRTNLQAWDYYHLGIAHFYRFTAADNLEAQRLLARSRELDPRFGEAHAWWAYATVLGMVYWDTAPAPGKLDEALAATREALALDDQNAVFYALKARVQLARREYRAAITENEMAISLNPSLAAAHCGLGDSLAYAGEYDAALERFRRAIELSPNDPQRWAFLTYGALALIFQGDYEEAVRWTERASEIPNCQYWTWAHQAVALARLERPEALARARQHLQRACPGFSLAFAREKLFYIERRDQLEDYLEGLALAGVE